MYIYQHGTRTINPRKHGRCEIPRPAAASLPGLRGSPQAGDRFHVGMENEHLQREGCRCSWENS